ncbi:hypothetical protein [Janthinobacterium violaceinigrum]|uniref:Uncharacterized protein n=1 Tax=Janthinobacterium violaceinigrum TaxID=2654252 RepID=A0A6I1HP01_9BURK|nr:hypothetical protein [Janthinobacterium violaceinigrum]KAB8058306.1 hypothetical protein GCN75_27965 [Janthinobacterium violaceinigrum]
MKILNSRAAPPSLLPANRRIVLSGEEQMRRILSAPFDTTLGADDMGDIERAVAALPLWRASDIPS